MVLRDEQWAALEPLIEACRPRGKTPPRDLRRTIGAIVWRHVNGARWRAAQLFIRRARLGVWPRLLEAAQARGVELGMAFLDGTSVRAHPKAAGAPKTGVTSRERDRREALGRSRGGFGTKACVIADGRGRAVAFALAPGQAHELPLAPGLLDRLPRVPLWVVGDRGYSSDAFRELIRSSGPRSRPGATRRPSPARTSSTTTATWSSGSGAGSRSGAPSPPATRRPRPATLACSASPPPPTGSSPNRA